MMEEAIRAQLSLGSRQLRMIQANLAGGQINPALHLLKRLPVCGTFGNMNSGKAQGIAISAFDMNIGIHGPTKLRLTIAAKH